MPNALIAAASYLLFALLVFAGLPLMALLYVLTWPFDGNRRAVGRTFRILGGTISRIYPGWRMKVLPLPKLEKGRPYVVVANHESTLDILLLSRLPWEMKWMAKRSLFEVPWLGWMMKLAGDIPVDRKDPHAGRRALEKARAYLSRGMNVMIFPEGTRSRDGRVLPFKAGAFRLAIETGATLLPVAVHGTASGMPVGTPWVRPTRAAAKVLEPVSTEGMTLEDLPALTELIRGRIQAARDELAGNLSPAEGMRSHTPAPSQSQCPSPRPPEDAGPAPLVMPDAVPDVAAPLQGKAV